MLLVLKIPWFIVSEHFVSVFSVGILSCTRKKEHFILFFDLFRATPTAYGGSQASGRIRAVAAGLCQSHSKAGFNHLEVSSFIGLLGDAGY